MAISLLSQTNSANSKTASSSISTTTTANLSAGDVIAVSVGADYDASLNISMAAVTNVTWTKVGQSDNTGGASAALFFGYLSGSVSSGATLTANLGVSVTAKAIHYRAFSGASSSYGSSATNTGTSTTPNVGGSGVDGNWWVTSSAWEGPTTDYGNMVVGNYLGGDGTSGSGATSNQSVVTAYDDASPLSTQVSLGTNSRDWAVVGGLLKAKDISVDAGSYFAISTPKSSNKEYWDLVYAGQYTGPVVASAYSAELVSSTYLILDKPTGTASGDLLIAALWRDDTSTVEVTPPSGWTKFSSSPAQLNFGTLDYFYKAAGGSEPASYTFTSSANQDRLGSIIRVTGADDTPSATGESNSGSEELWTISIGLSVAQNDLLVVFDFAVLSQVQNQLAGPNLVLDNGSLIRQGDAPSVSHFGVWSRPQTSASESATTSTGWPEGTIHGVVAIVVNKAAGSGTVSGSFTADAVIKKTGNTGSFLASAALKRTESGTVTAQSVLKKVNTGSVTADAVIKKTIIASLVAEALIKRRESGTFTAESSVAYVGNPVWVSPASGGSISTTPTFTFTIPTAPGPQHFELLLDTADTFNTGSLRTVQSWVSQTGWEYHNGSTWTAVPVAGVTNTYAGNNARHTVQTPLSTGTTWYWKLRAGIE